ncbi:MAG: 4Fe-4S dicluster domain-containing protein [Desulfobacteraceae bacterium]|nr:4Fe-4S dicluster domain-containing protein [Desulfobacteraceae bacterium]
MVEKVKARVQELLASGKVKGFIGLRELHGHIGPYLFTDGGDLDGFVIGDRKAAGDTRYPLNTQLIMISRQYPEETLGVLVRGCDERGLKTLFNTNQLKPEKVVSVGIACPQELADVCECMKPFPEEFVAGEASEARPFGSVERIESIEIGERLKVWLGEFAKCIKCYGCRNICPMCYCPECTLEAKDFQAVGSIASENPIFHLTRALHMAGRCIDCGLCSEACPADIPLRTLYKKIADIVDLEFQYRPGYQDSKGKMSPNVLGEAAKH